MSSKKKKHSSPGRSSPVPSLKKSRKGGGGGADGSTGAAAAAGGHSDSSPSAAGASSSAAAPGSSSSRGTGERPLADSSTHDLFGYLESLPRRTLLRLYASPDRGHFACRAVLQRLPELARQYAVRLTVCGGEFPLDVAELWTARGSRSAEREARRAVRRMEQLCVIEPLSAGGGSGGEGDDELGLGEDGNGNGDGNGGDGDGQKKVLRLTAEFKAGMERSLTSLQSAPWPSITPEQADRLRAEAIAKDKSQAGKYPKPPTADELEMYTQRRWDSVLHFLVGSSPSDVEDPPSAVVLFLERTGLMQEDPEWRPPPKFGHHRHEQQAPLVITSRGYEFMLQDVHVQVWQFVLQYFKSLESHRKCDEIRAEALLFLIGLSFCRVGRAYPAGALSKDAKILMRDFSQFGLLYVTKIGELKAFYPTRVAVNLVAGSLAEAADKSGRGASASASRALEAAIAAPVPSRSHLAVIVQTNFQLVAYTSSELHVSMLGLFCEVRGFVRMPNVVFFHITRDSVKSAFKLGIEAAQVLRFLRMHAHPRLRTGNSPSGEPMPLIPPNVEDQILLWDRERTRVQMEEVYLLQCRGVDEFGATAAFADDVGAYSWGNEDNCKLYVRYDLAERVVAFVRRWRSRRAARGMMGAPADAAGGGDGGGEVGSGRKKKRSKQRHGSYA